MAKGRRGNLHFLPFLASDFILKESTEENYSEFNFAAFSTQAQRNDAQNPGESYLALKATNKLEHEGGESIKRGGAAHIILNSFTKRVAGLQECDPVDEPPLDIPFYKDIVFHSDVETFRRATLNFSGRLPTSQEILAIDQNGEQGLSDALDELMKENAFNDRLREVWYDILLTQAFGGVPIGVFGYTHFSPTRFWWRALYQAPEIYKVVEDVEEGIIRTPAELVVHLVKNDLDFREILTANYMMVTPYTARSWGMYDDASGTYNLGTGASFSDPNDVLEFQPARIPQLHYWEGKTSAVWPSNDTGYYAHAGLLSSFSFLRRYPTTDSNKNRLRARTYLRLFLGEDIMERAPAVVDSAAVDANFDIPVMQAPDCVVCHTTLDPIAGLFRDYAGNSEVRRLRDEEWEDNTVFYPGMDEQTPFPKEERWRSMQWLAERTVTQPAFAETMVDHGWYMLSTEFKPVQPKDIEDPLFEYKLKAYKAQRDMIRDATAVFVADNYNFKSALKSLILSNYYRAKRMEQKTDDIRRESELQKIGLGVQLTPELLSRKVGAIFGENWREIQPGGDLYMLYGGLDFFSIPDRVTDPNGVMGAISRQLANEISCEYVQKDLFENNGNLLSGITPGESDETKIRDALIDLHWKLHGEFGLAADDPKINRAFGLYQTLLQDGMARIQSGDESQSLPDACNPYFQEDGDFTIRAWQGVLIYMLRHPQFLMQ